MTLWWCLGGGLSKRGDHFAPSDYEECDDFGMLGGEMRVVAAVLAYLHGMAFTFLFSTGRTQKMMAKYGDEIPTEARVYADHFRVEMVLRAVDTGILQPIRPVILLEEKSVTTRGNLEEIGKIVVARGFRRTAIVSSGYHIPRVKMLWNIVVGNLSDVTIEFISAEVLATELINKTKEGVLDKYIADAFSTPVALLRMKNEENGLEALRNGTYAITEFQLTEKK